MVASIDCVARAFHFTGQVAASKLTLYVLIWIWTLTLHFRSKACNVSRKWSPTPRRVHTALTKFHWHRLEGTSSWYNAVTEGDYNWCHCSLVSFTKLFLRIHARASTEIRAFMQPEVRFRPSSESLGRILSFAIRRICDHQRNLETWGWWTNRTSGMLHACQTIPCVEKHKCLPL